MHFNGFIASLACVHKIIEPADNISKLFEWNCITLPALSYSIVIQKYSNAFLHRYLYYVVILCAFVIYVLALSALLRDARERPIRHVRSVLVKRPLNLSFVQIILELFIAADNNKHRWCNNKSHIFWVLCNFFLQYCKVTTQKTFSTRPSKHEEWERLLGWGAEILGSQEYQVHEETITRRNPLVGFRVGS